MRTLVLNAGYEPLAVVSFKRALVLVLAQKASIVQADEEHPVWSPSGVYERPSVILLTRYVHRPYGSAALVSRRGVLRRDRHRCGYCLRPATTVDHVVPRSRGGADAWENLVACCQRCNNRKGDHTPAEMGWTLRLTPVTPYDPAWRVRGMEHARPEWEGYLAPAA